MLLLGAAGLASGPLLARGRTYERFCRSRLFQVCRAGGGGRPQQPNTGPRVVMTAAAFAVGWRPLAIVMRAHSARELRSDHLLQILPRLKDGPAVLRVSAGVCGRVRPAVVQRPQDGGRGRRSLLSSIRLRTADKRAERLASFPDFLCPSCIHCTTLTARHCRKVARRTLNMRKVPFKGEGSLCTCAVRKDVAVANYLPYCSRLISIAVRGTTPALA